MYRSIQLSKTLARPIQQQTRGYASAPSGGGSNLPLLLAVAGVAGLGGYVYLDRNPSAKSAIDAKTQESIAKAKELEQSALSKSKQFLSQGEQKAQDLKSKAEAKGEELKGKGEDLKEKAFAKGEELKDKAVASGEDVKTNGTAAFVKDTWHEFKLSKKENYNHNTDVYTFDFPDPTHNAGATVASALLVKSTDPEAVVDDKGKPVIRPYTPITSPDTKGHLKLLIKKYPGGKISQHVDSLNIGDSLSFKGPISKFPYEANKFDDLVFIAGGSGITPAYQLFDHALSIPDDKTKLTLIFSNVTQADILLKKEWDSLASAHPDRLKVIYALDKPSSGLFKSWKGETGYVNAEMVKKYAPAPGSKVKIFVCGPPGQVQSLAGAKTKKGAQGDLAGVLKELNYTEDDVFKF